ncbi:MAG: L,D-transpeptidase family protein [Chitinophagaceae bacterium]
MLFKTEHVYISQTFLNTIPFTSILLLLLLLHSHTSCQHGAGQNRVLANPKDSIVSSAVSGINTLRAVQVHTLDTETVKEFFIHYPALLSLKAQVLGIYQKRKYTYIWYDGNALKAQANSLYSHVINISSEGLEDKTLYKTDFTSLIEGGFESSAELMLTCQYLLYTKYVWVGLDQKERKEIKWYLPANKLSPAKWLDSLDNYKNLFDAPPLYRQYDLLKIHLKKYLDISGKTQLPFIRADRKVYRKGDSSLVINAVRKWLFITGDTNLDSNAVFFDEKLEASVKNFQLRFGLAGTGIVDAACIRQMNISVAVRIQQIKVNMERSRWISVPVSSDYLVINIPEYKLHMYENNELVWSMNVVAGKPTHATVIFTGDIKYVVFSPYWNVPPGILHKEVLPGINKNSHYLSAHDMEWSGGNVRQRPGPENPLGLVKFLFPNSYNIYLHDTPVKSLFTENSRGFSHGCIRLEDARKLAVYLLRNDRIWNASKIDSAMHRGQELSVLLIKPEPVFIAYFTAWVDRQGGLNFRNDTYGRDKPLGALLVNKSPL